MSDIADKLKTVRATGDKLVALFEGSDYLNERLSPEQHTIYMAHVHSLADLPDPDAVGIVVDYASVRIMSEEKDVPAIRAAIAKLEEP